MKSEIEILNLALQNNSPLRVEYHGGSQPGTVREIIPVKLGSDEVRAFDTASNRAKIFKLAKLEIVRGDTPITYGTATQQFDDSAGQAIGDVFSPLVMELERMGWSVKTETDSVALYRKFKNGKWRKRPDVELSYASEIVDIILDEHGRQFSESRPSKRPYRVASKGFGSARTFTKLASAAKSFM